MKNMGGDSDESTKTTGIKTNVKSTLDKSHKSTKYKSSAMLQDANEEMEHDELFDWPESPITKIK
jgi:hypothetical protein